MEPIELTLEQKLSLRILEVQAKKLNAEQLREIVITMAREIAYKEAIYKQLFVKQLGISP